MKKVILLVLTFTVMLMAERVAVTEQYEITRPFLDKVKVGEQCYEDTVTIKVSCGRDTNSIGVDTLVGAVIGVAIGNQIGGGNGRDVARVVGGLGGAKVANDMRNQECTSYETITRCEPKYEYKTKKRFIGWNNCATIDGKQYCEQTKNPVNYLNVTKTVTVY